MNKHFRIYSASFIICLIVLYSLFSIFDSNVLLIAIGITSLAFFIYHIIRAIIFFGEKEKLKGILNLIISLLLVTIMLKINYQYYNFVFCITTILIGILYLNKSKNTTKSVYKLICLLFIIINIISLFTPDTLLLKYEIQDKKAWTSNLTWDSFKGQPNKDSKFNALILTEFSGKSNKVYNYPPAILLAVVLEDKSWKKLVDDSESNASLLEHEQGHFDITEIYRRKALDSTELSWGKNSESIENILFHFSEQEDIHQILYDSITNHGLNQKQQEKWIKRISQQLND